MKLECVNDVLAEMEEERENLNLSRMQLSYKAFGRKESYRSVLSNRTNPTVTTLNKIAEALNMKLVICLVEK